MDEERLRKEWARVGELLPEPLRARIRDYHTEGVKALLEFHDTIGRMIEERE
jgi:hypothetical protein